ncbi:hypothetical protein BDR07DRAFT_1436038 [Suillus spraguei]|nr:hypothetical protein BDR07DRAFT_1436038 [Suillus spraguei]
MLALQHVRLICNSHCCHSSPAALITDTNIKTHLHFGFKLYFQCHQNRLSFTKRRQ